MKRLSTAAATIGVMVVFDQAIKLGVQQVMEYQERIDLAPFFALFLTHNSNLP